MGDYHLALRIAGALLACLLAICLPLLFATLFETAYSRRSRGDWPVICSPWIGSLVLILGATALAEASALMVWAFSNEAVTSAKSLCERFAGVPNADLPRTACIERAFVKTDWE